MPTTLPERPPQAILADIRASTQDDRKASDPTYQADAMRLCEELVACLQDGMCSRREAAKVALVLVKMEHARADAGKGPALQVSGPRQLVWRLVIGAFRFGGFGEGLGALNAGLGTLITGRP